MTVTTLGGASASPTFRGTFSDYVDKAVGFLKSGKRQDAMALLDRLCAAKPGDAGLISLLGYCYLDAGALGTAIEMLSRAISIDPKNDMAWHNLGVALRRAEHYESGRAALMEAIKIAPDRADTMAMICGAYVNTGDPRPGIEWGRKALSITPDDPHTHNNLAHLLLELGQFREGWEHYAVRWETPQRKHMKRDFGSIPKWDGKPVKTLAVHGEQGLGDEILFCSLLHEVKADEIVIECAGRLVQLFERSFGARCYPTHEALMAVETPDAWIPMGDLPRFFRNRKEDFKRQRKAFLKADPERVKYWRSVMEEKGPGPYVGIAWMGGKAETHQSLRCLPLEKWGQILGKKATFVSAQYGIDPKEPETFGVHHWNEAIDDLDEFAAFVSACDLIITVCQTAVHFAGGLGKETWCLTPKAAAWRYGLKGDMLWYPTVKCFRQENEWAEVIEAVARELDKRILQGAERTTS